jgi:eukaryotic-like serine/threonine-protein kinase
MKYSFNELKNICPLVNGGQKQVSLAEHPLLGKVIYKTGKFSNPSSLERIKREIDFLSSVNTPHFPQNHSFQVDSANNTFHIIEEYIDGSTLERPGIFSNEIDIIRFLRQVLIPLMMLWNRQIVHRDLKPQNIMLRKDGMVVVIDLGIARFLELDSLTNTFNLMGPCTPVYAAPEQLRNEKKIIDERTDFFSLGIVALEGFLGFHPFDPAHVGNTNNIVENIVKGIYVQPSSIKSCSPAFSGLFNGLLRPRQHQRFRQSGILSSYLSTNWGA